jgi:hypothetical protein
LSARGTLTLLNNALLSAHFLFADYLDENTLFRFRTANLDREIQLAGIGCPPALTVELRIDTL